MLVNKNSKTIQLLLYDGDFDGVFRLSDDSWQSGELLCAPRERISELIKTKEISYSGIYMLLSENKVYIGQSTELNRRMNDHLTDKDWWTKAIVIITRDDHLDRTDIDYLEYMFIKEAKLNSNFITENVQKGNTPKLNTFSTSSIWKFFDEARFLLKMIGVTVFDKPGKHVLPASNEDEPITPANELNIAPTDVITINPDESVKMCAVRAFIERGYDITNLNCTFASLQKKGNPPVYWANPDKSKLNIDWFLILNDQNKKIIRLIKIPANTYAVGEEPHSGYFITRKDDKKNGALSMFIDSLTFIDKTSDINLKNHIIDQLKY